MEVAEFFLKLSIILVAAKFSAEAFAYFGLPSVIGEVVAGVIIGPSLFGLVTPDPTFHLLANIGVLFLLFEVGVDTDVGQLVSVGGQSVLVAVTGVALPFAFGYALSRYGFGHGQMTALFIGGTLVATSIGITLRVIKDLGRQRTSAAQVVLGAAVLDDVIGVVMLAVLMNYTLAGSLELAASLKVMVFIGVFLVAAPVLSRFFISFMEGVYARSRTAGVLSTLVVTLILVLSVLAHDFGAPEIVGAFAAGLLMTRKCMFFCPADEDGSARRRIIAKAEEKMTPIGELFIPVFFVMVGVSIDFRVVEFGSAWFWAFAGTLTAAAFVSKVLSGSWVKGPMLTKLTVGVAMIPRGEVGLIFAEKGLESGAFDDTVYASVVFVVALTTLIAPLMMKSLMERGRDG